MLIRDVEYYSPALGRNTTYTVMIPDALAERATSVSEDSDIPYVMITHGMWDDTHSWLRGTRIESLLEGHSFAAVAPDARLSYYTDTSTGEKFYTQLTEELPYELTRSFGFTKNRARRFVMGNSMGGYGAFKLALSRTDLFSASISLSGVTDIVYRIVECRFWPDVAEKNWGADYAKTLPGSDSDLYTLVRRALVSNSSLPELWQICGTEDYLYEDNIRFRRFMEEIAYPYYKYTEDKGEHFWDFWDRMLPSALDYFESKL